MIGLRIKQVRLASGLTLEDLAQKMTTAGHPITKAAISKYELSKSIPRPAFVLGLARALGVRPSYFGEIDPVHVNWIAYRKRSRLPVKKQEQIQAIASQVVEDQLRLQSLLYPEIESKLPVTQEATSVDDAEKASVALRKAWGLDDCPIDSLTALVEDHGGVVVACDEVSEDFDGLAGKTTSGFPVAVVNMCVSDDRRRFNLAHELGHLILDCESATPKMAELLANRFASALLVPAAVAKSELGNKRRRLDFRELGLLKQKYGLSIQGWIRRAMDLGIIDEPQFKSLCIEIGCNNWKRSEPFAFQGSETPSRLRQMTLRAFSEGIISAQRAEQIVPGCTDKMTATKDNTALSAAEIRRLPRAQRAALLATAAELAEADYTTNHDLTDFDAFGKDDLYDGEAESNKR